MSLRLKEDTLRCLELIQQLNSADEIDSIRYIAMRISALYKQSPDNYAKILTSKKNCAYPPLISCLRDVQDLETHLCLLNILVNIFNTDKKIAKFVHNFGTEGVLESLIFANRIKFENDEVYYQFLFRLSQKDSKFSTKCRLFKAIPIFIEKLKRELNHPAQAKLLLIIIRRCSVMQATCITMNKYGIFGLMIKFLQVYSLHDSAILSLTLEIFRLFIKNKLINSKSNWNTYIKALLVSYSEFNTFDAKLNRIQDRIVILQAMKIIASHSKGSIYLAQTDAFNVLTRLLYITDFSAIEKDKEMLKFMNLMLEIVRFCIPAKSLPLATLYNPIQFPIQQTVKQESTIQSVNDTMQQKFSKSLSTLKTHSHPSEESICIVKSNSLPNLSNFELNSKNVPQNDHFVEKSMVLVDMWQFFPEFDSNQHTFTPFISPDILTHEVKLVFDRNRGTIDEDNLPLRHLYNQPITDPPIPFYTRGVELPKEITLANVARCMQPDKYINQVVYDIENYNDDVITQRDRPILQFDSVFECGNLRKATLIIDNTYDLILNTDINSDKHVQWFYFKVSTMLASVEYTFNIINMEKVNSQFNFGMQPVLFSTKSFNSEKNRSWYRCGDKIYWYKNKYTGTMSGGESVTKSFFTLTFTIEFPFENDDCYIAYHYPYSYTNLQRDILEWLTICDTSCYLNVQSLCNTLNSTPCPLLTITNVTNTIPMEDKKYIVLTGRVHPGEHNASWVMKGLIDFLLSSNQKAIHLRENYIFKIIPMLNPDGVINGNLRCNLAAYDLNRTWKDPSSMLHPTIFYSKSLIEHLIFAKKTPILFCDFHGHSRRKNIFMFGCPSMNKIESVFPILYNEIFPGFSIEGCSYQIEQSKLTCGRVVVGQQLGVQCSYTLESSYCGFDIGPYKGLQLNIKMLEESGMAFLLTLERFEDRLIEFISRNLTDRVDFVNEVVENEYSSTDEDF